MILFKAWFNLYSFEQSPGFRNLLHVDKNTCGPVAGKNNVKSKAKYLKQVKILQRDDSVLSEERHINCVLIHVSSLPWSEMHYALNINKSLAVN